MAESPNYRVLPRQLAEGVTWIGECMEVPYQGRILHSYDSLFLVAGDHSSMLIEAGFPGDRAETDRQLAAALTSAPPLRYIFLTHQEIPHAGGLGRLLQRFPEARAVGDVRDYHLFLPEFESRLDPLQPGDRIDLGGTEVEVVRPVIKDLISTQWAFDVRSRTLFPGDGFAFAHHHESDECGSLTEEIPSLDITAMAEMFVDAALPWMRYVDMGLFAEALADCVESLGVENCAPTHGLPTCAVAELMPKIRASLVAAPDA